MIKSLQVFDDFLDAPYVVRGCALELNDFKPREYLGHTYMGIGMDYDPKITEQISKAVGWDIQVKLAFFRLGLEGDKTTSFIHADTSVNAKWAGILYLSHPTGPMQGTAFWYNKTLEVCKTPEMDCPHYAEWVAANADTINNEANDTDKWAQTGLLGMKFNRFAVYPTSYFHSRWPRDTWGKKNEDGRLIYVIFFN